MRNQLNQFQNLFEQVRGLGIVMQLPNEKHTPLSKHINVWFDDNYSVTSIQFGDHFKHAVELTRYKHDSDNLRLSMDINTDDEALETLLNLVTNEYKLAKIEYLESELIIAKNEIGVTV